MPEETKQRAYISKLYLKNYKKYDEVHVNFSPGLNILVGPNNAGKTTILEALDILLCERNMSPLSINRSFFHSFNSGQNNTAKIILEIAYPKECGKNQKEVNFIKQLKIGKGSSRSKIPHGEHQNHLTIEDFTNETINDSGWEFVLDTNKSGFEIKNIFLITNITISDEYQPDVSYDIYLNIDRVSSDNINQQMCYKIIGVTGSQRSSLFNYLFLPANRINNKSLTEITEFNWIGRYLRNYTNKNSLNEKLKTFSESNCYPSSILDTNVQTILSKLHTTNEKISIDLINKDDNDTVITNAKIYIRDGYNDEITNKAHGLQSAAIISLFAGWCKFQSQNYPINPKVFQMWNTVLSFEEPESHFHFPIRNKLMRVLQDEFLLKGAQIFISTHDNTFINWQYINIANLVFPNSMSGENIISSLDLKKIQDNYKKRMVRFNAPSFFSDMVLVVEGQEEVCLDLIYQVVANQSLQEEGIILTRSVSKIHSDGNETADTQPSGGKDQIVFVIKFFSELNIQTLCLIDIDCLFGESPTVLPIYKQLTETDITLSKQYEANSDNTYLKLKKWWNDNKNDSDLQNDLIKLSEAGIFIFPGDFESLFTDNYLSSFKKHDEQNKIVKEKLTYDTRFLIETNFEDIIAKLSEEGKNFIMNSIARIHEFVEKKRIERNKIKIPDPILVEQITTVPNNESDIPF